MGAGWTGRNYVDNLRPDTAVMSGGAFSGKDPPPPPKGGVVERSAAYWALSAPQEHRARALARISSVQLANPSRC